MRQAFPAMVVTAIIGFVFLSVPVNADFNYCDATPAQPICTIHCHDGDHLYISVTDYPGHSVNGIVRCGELATGCSNPLAHECTSQGWPVIIDDDDGICQLVSGTNAHCENAVP